MSIVINNLRKRYKENEVLNSLTYTFEDGVHYLIKGENGIGKSTLLKSILRQVKFDGECIVEGTISYSPEDTIFPSFMSVKSFIKTFSTLNYDVANIDELIEGSLKEFNIEGFEKKMLGSLSKGQKMKVNLITALLTPSDILIMDEPLSGLDTDSKKVLLKKLKNDKRLIIVISHETNAFRKSNYSIVTCWRARRDSNPRPTA